MENKINTQAQISYNYNQGKIRVDLLEQTSKITLDVRHINLKVKKTTSSYFYKPGDLIDISVTITNVGNYPAEEIVLVDDITNMNFVENTCYLLNTTNCIVNLNPTVEKDNIIIDIGSIKPNESIIINYQAKIKLDVENSLDITNVATVYAKRLAPIYSNIITINQYYAKLIYTKSVSRDYVYNSDAIELYLRIKNIGNASASEIIVTENLPSYFTLLNEKESVYINNEAILDYSYDEENRTVKILIDSLNSDDEVIITIKGKVYIK